MSEAGSADREGKLHVAIVARYESPFPYSENELDYPVMAKLGEQLGRVSLILQSRSRQSAFWSEGPLSVYYAPRHPSLLRAPTFVRWATKKLLSLHRQEPIHVVNGSELLGGLAALISRRKLGARFVLQLQGELLDPPPGAYPFPKGWIIDRLATFLSRKADLVRCVYKEMANALIAEGISPDRVRVIPSRFDPGLFNPVALPRTRPAGDGNRVVFVGTLVRGKGVSHMLEALAVLHRRNVAVRADIVGDGPERQSLEARAERLGLGAWVYFLGRVPYSRVPETIAGYECLVLPSLSEGNPRALMEGMAMELPVVSTRVGGIPEVVVDGENGFLVPPGDPEALADALEYVLTNPQHAKEMGRAARRWVLERFTLDRHVRAMVDLHRSVARQKHAHR